MNDNFFKYVKITNFKSLKDLNISCKRLNLFIGYPNVGKSNILEALSLFDISIIKQIIDEEIDELISFDSDLFLNIDRYL